MRGSQMSGDISQEKGRREGQRRSIHQDTGQRAIGNLKGDLPTCRHIGGRQQVDLDRTDVVDKRRCPVNRHAHTIERGRQGFTRGPEIRRRPDPGPGRQPDHHRHGCQFS